MTDPTPTPLPEWLVPEYVQEWARTVSLFDLLVWVVGLVVAIVVIRWVRVKGWPWLKRAARALARFIALVESVGDLPEFIDRTDRTLGDQSAAIAEIHHEVHFNNGSSVKDGLKRVEDDVTAVKRALGIETKETDQ